MINPYLTGNTRYGSSSSPTRGTTLDPSGYINRESQRRSQLAQQALQRSATGTNQAGAQVQPIQASGTVNNAPAFVDRTDTGRILPAPIANFENPIAPTTTSPPVGQPPDETYNTMAWQAGSDWQNNARQLLSQRQMAELAYSQQARGLQEMLDRVPGDVRNQASKAGMLRSSMMGKTLDEQLRGVGDQITSALDDRNFAAQAYTTGLADLTGNYSQLMALAAQNLASRNAANAGKLGLGTPSDADKALADSAIGGQIKDIIQPPTNPWTPPPLPQTPAPQAPAPVGGGGISIPAGTYRQGYNNPTMVRQIQQLVGAKVDGIWGNETTRKIKEWQAAHNLTADGIIGKNTIAAMAGG